MLFESIAVGLFIAMLQLDFKLQDLLFPDGYNFLLAEIVSSVNTIFKQERLKR